LAFTGTPELVMVMRHARAQPALSPSEISKGARLRDDVPTGSSTATADVTETGRALAETLHEWGRAEGDYRRLIVLSEQEGLAALTADILAKAYESARTVNDWKRAPERAERRPFNVAPASPYTAAADARAWAETAIAELPKPADNERLAVVLVGHDPRMGWLLARLLDRDPAAQDAKRAAPPDPTKPLHQRPEARKKRQLTSPRQLIATAHHRMADRLAVRRRRALLPGLMHTELVACARTADGRYEAVWALSPTDDKAHEAIQAKIRSKMDTSKVFATVLAAGTGFIAKEVASQSGWRLKIGLLGLAGLGLATVLHLVTMFWYDRLLMPSRFWAVNPSRRWSPQGAPLSRRHLLERPPSSGTWVLYQSMQMVWAFCFIPATIAAGSGIALYVAAIAEVSPISALVLLSFAAALVWLTLALAREGRPRLGSND
jgi:hypothetical protein